MSAASTSSAGTISNLIVTPLSGDNPHNSRVQATITIPVEVIYVDANNVEGKGTAEIVDNEHVKMCLPDNSVISCLLSTSDAADGALTKTAVDGVDNKHKDYTYNPSLIIQN